MIVELIGPPCAGKSTFLRKVKYSDKVVISNISFNYLKLHQKAIVVFLFFKFSSMTSSRKLVAFVFKKLKTESRFPISHKINVLRNVYKKVFLHVISLYLDTPDRLVLIDEGINHIPFNFVRMSQAEFEEFRLLIIEFGGTEICMFSEDFNTLIRRFNKRGHKRTKFMSAEEIVQSSKVIEELFFGIQFLDVNYLVQISGSSNVL